MKNDLTILIVDDEEETLELITNIIKSEMNFIVITAVTVDEAINKFDKYHPHLAILDIKLPDGEGFQICNYIRKHSQIPIFFLTAYSEVDNLYKSFEVGADDYMTKPFLQREFLLRLNAMIWRSYGDFMNEVLIVDGKICLNNATIIRNNVLYKLTKTELLILELLILNKNQIVTSEKIIDYVWGDYSFTYNNTLMSHISNIRRKIENDPAHPIVLLTAKGIGYKLKVGDINGNT